MQIESQESLTSVTAEGGDSDETPGRVFLESIGEDRYRLWLGARSERVVTLTVERMQSLEAVLDTLQTKNAKGVIIIGPSQDMFTAGADLNLIKSVSNAKEAEDMALYGQRVFRKLAALKCPTVAAISGPCVGGGCEMVLACRNRIITDQPSSLIGLPEIKLGILPGFGGTQRLPRLVGLPKALDIILAGKTLRPKQALSCGLVDKIVKPEDLLEAAEKFLVAAAPKPKAIKLVDKFLTYTSIGRSIVRRRATKSVARETKGFYPAPPSALEAVLLGLEQGMETGERFEARELGRLIVTPESKSLVRIFFLTEGAKALGKSARKHVDHTYGVVVGAGVMGAGIAGVLAKNGCSAILRDISSEQLERAKEQIKKYVSKFSYLSETDRSFILNRVETTTKDSANFGNANFAIEAIFEELDIKRKVLSELDKLVPHEAVLATNTSSLSVTQIAEGITNPERVVGMHFFNPVEKMPLVEIIRATKTNDKTVAIVAALAVKLGKFPIVVEDVPGFLVNRILCPYLSEAAYLLKDGFSILSVDKAALKFGMPMGPIRLLDEVGLDVAQHVAQTMQNGYGDRMQGPNFVNILVERGRLGKKNGAGFYDYSDDSAAPSSEIGLILGISQEKGQSSGVEEIQDRLVLSLINEAVRCLDEGVAGAPSPEAAQQIDLGSVMGFGFPPFRGGILNYAQSVGAQTIHTKLAALATQYGDRFSPALGIKVRADKKLSFFEAI